MDLQYFETVLERISLPGGQSETFQNFLLEVKLSSDFLKHHSSDGSYDCVVVQKLKKKQASNYEEIESMSENLELIGSPLKCTFENDYTVIEEDTQLIQVFKNDEFSPVDLKSARFLISLYNRCCTKKSILPIIILCDGEKENIVLIASKYIDKGLNWIVMTLESVESIPKNVPKLETLRRKHLFGISHDKIETVEVMSSYDFSSISSKSVKSKQNINLNFKWKNPTELYEFPPKGCTCELLVEGENDESQSLISDFSGEIRILEKLVQNSYATKNDLELSDLRHKMFQILSDLKKMTLYPKQRDRTDGSEKNVVLFAVSPRQLDVTDYIWNFLKNVPEYCHSLINSLLLNENINDVKHMIFKTNNTKLAKLIREGKCRSFCPSEKESLELLIEIGFEKLQRDYVNFFTVSELASKESIDSILKDATCDYKTRVDKLKSLHGSLDLILKCGIVLEMPRRFHANFTSQVLKLRDPDSNSFHCKIPSEMMTPLLKNRSPTNWRVNFTSKDRLYAKISIHQFSTNRPIAWTEDINNQWHHLSTEEISDQSLYWFN